MFNLSQLSRTKEKVYWIGYNVDQHMLDIRYGNETFDTATRVALTYTIQDALAIAARNQKMSGYNTIIITDNALKFSEVMS